MAVLRGFNRDQLQVLICWNMDCRNVTLGFVVGRQGQGLVGCSWSNLGDVELLLPNTGLRR